MGMMMLMGVGVEYVSSAAVVSNDLLLEDSSHILFEDGFKLILEA